MVIGVKAKVLGTVDKHLPLNSCPVYTIRLLKETANCQYSHMLSGFFHHVLRSVPQNFLRWGSILPLTSGHDKRWAESSYLSRSSEA